MSAALTAKEPSAKYLVNVQPPLVRHFDLIAQAPGGVARLRELILTLAVQGKLVPQDPSDEPASELLKKIRTEKERLIAEGKIKRGKPLAEITDEERPFELPISWQWTSLGMLAKKLTDGSHNPPRDAGVGYPMLSSQNVWEHGFIDFSSPTRYVGHEDFAVENKRTNAEPGDVLLTIVASIGRAAVVPEDAPLFVLQRSVAVVQADLNPAYLALFLRSPVARAFYDLHGKGTAQKGIYLGKLGTLPVAVPPIFEQSRIVTRVEELMQLCDALEASGQLEAQQHAQLVSSLLGTLTQSETSEALADNWQRIATHFDVLLDRPEAVDALEQTILQLAVRGLLVPQDPTDEPASVLLQKIRTEKDHLIAQGKTKRDKPLPPITDEEKPFELPQGWEWVRLNDLIRIGSGDGLTAAQMAPNGTIPVYGGNGVNGHHDHANVEEPTLVIGRVGYYCGSVHITPARAWVTDNAFITRYSKSHLEMSWLYWLLVGTNLKENDSATAQPVISGRKLYPIVVALPPLAEQSRIVTRVNELRSLCADLGQRLTAGQKAQAHLADALVST